MEEENIRTEDAGAETQFGKFRTADALVHAYEQLEAEFTRRSQRLKALEAEKKAAEDAMQAAGAAQTPSSPAQPDAEALYRAVCENEGVRSRIVSEYLAGLGGVPLMAGGGAPVTAPKTRARSFAEAGDLALGYFRSHNKQ